MDGDSVDVRGRRPGYSRDGKTIRLPYVAEQLRDGGDDPRLARATLATFDTGELAELRNFALVVAYPV
jgi:hypothetical protein